MDTNLILLGVTFVNTIILGLVAWTVFRILQTEKAQQADLILLLNKAADNVPKLLAATPPAAQAGQGALTEPGGVLTDLERLAGSNAGHFKVDGVPLDKAAEAERKAPTIESDSELRAALGRIRDRLGLTG